MPRLLIAVGLPPEVRRELARAQRRLAKPSADVRWVDADRRNSG